MNIKLYEENGELNFINLIKGEVLSLYHLEFTCDMTSLQTRGLDIIKRSGNGDDVSQDLLTICRPATAQLLAQYLKQGGKEAVKEIKQVSKLALKFVSCYLDKWEDKADWKLHILEKEAESVFLYGYDKIIDVRFHKINAYTQTVFCFDTLRGILCFDCYNALHIYKGIESIPIKVKLCQNCGRYFVVKGRSATLYCDYSAPQNHKYKCNDTQLVRFYGSSDLQINIKKRRQRLLSTWATKVKRHPENETAHYVFEQFKKQDDRIKLDVNKGRWSEEEYLDFLRHFPTPKEYKQNPEAFAKLISEAKPKVRERKKRNERV